MSTTTPTLGLTLYDSTTDQVVTFATFRAVWGGTATTSNFYKIDTWAGTVNSSISTLQNQRGAIPVSASYISANYYEATVASITSYVTGMTILLKLDTDSAGTVTLNISALGTKSITKVNSSGTVVNIASGELQSNRYYLFTYDGTQWIWVDANSSDQTYVVGGTSGNVLTVNSDNSILGTLTQSLLISDTIHAATTKSTPVDADEVGIADSAASYVLKRLTWANIKATLKTYFDSIYNESGWRTLSATLTYSSADSPSFVISSNADLTSVLSLGMKIWFTNNSTSFYGFVTAIGSWSGSAQLITLYGGTDYTVANSAITSPYYSTSKAPFGFNIDPTKWTVVTTSTSNCAIASPTDSTWYGNTALTPTAPSISIPIGKWTTEYSATLDTTFTTVATTVIGSRVSLSSSASSESDATMSRSFASTSPTVTGGILRFPFGLTPAKQLTLASKTTYYLIVYANVSTITNLALRGDLFTTTISAKCAYL